MEAEAPLEISAKRVAPDRRFQLAAAASGMTFVALFMGVALGPSAALWAPMGLAGVLAVVSLMTTVVFGFLGLLFTRKAGTLRLDGGALAWNGRALFARSRLRDAIAYANGPRHGVRVRSRWRTEFFDVADAEDADRIVAALGKESRQAATTFHGGSGTAAGVWWILYVLSPGHSPATRMLVSGIAACAIAWAVSRSIVTQWVVGSDGLLVRRVLGRPRFIPYAEVDAIRPTGRTLRIALRDGTELALASQDDSKAGWYPVVGAAALGHRIEQARRRAAERAVDGHVAAELARGERDVHAWIASLRGLTERAATYRVPAVPRDRLWSALEDVTQPAQVRAAAATALGPRLALEERPRLRVAAEACASPDLRVALEAAEQDDEERLGEALDALEGKAARRSRA